MRRLSKVQQFSWIKIYFKNTQWSSCNRFLLLLHAVNISISMILPFSWLTWLVLEGRVCAVSWVYAISWLQQHSNHGAIYASLLLQQQHHIEPHVSVSVLWDMCTSLTVSFFVILSFLCMQNTLTTLDDRWQVYNSTTSALKHRRKHHFSCPSHLLCSIPRQMSWLVSYSWAHVWVCVCACVFLFTLVCWAQV